MIKKLTLVLAMICVLSSVGTAFAADYLGNPRSMKFHYTTCRTIKHPENFVPIDSRDEAIAEGYVPCLVAYVSREKPLNYLLYLKENTMSTTSRGSAHKKRRPGLTGLLHVN